MFKFFLWTLGRTIAIGVLTTQKLGLILALFENENTIKLNKLIKRKLKALGRPNKNLIFNYKLIPEWKFHQVPQYKNLPWYKTNFSVACPTQLIIIWLKDNRWRRTRHTLKLVGFYLIEFSEWGPNHYTSMKRMSIYL